MAQEKTIGGVDEQGFAINVPYNANIPVSSIAPTIPLTLATPQYKDFSSGIANNLSYTQSAYDNQVANVDALNQQAKTENTDLAKLTSQMGGKGVDTNLAYQQTGATNLAAEIRKLNAQSNALAMDTQAKTLAEQNKATGQNITSQAVQRNTADATRENFINQANIAMQVAIKTADYQTAKDLADQIVNAKYDQLEADIKAKEINLDGIYKQLTPAEKKVADMQKVLLERENQDIADKKAQEMAISNVGMTLRKYGVDDSVVKDVLENSKSLNDALIRAGSNLQDPQAKMELESIRLDQVLKKAQIQRQYRETQLLGEPSTVETKATAQALKEAKSSIPVMQDKIDTINILKDHSGLSSRVGTGILTRTPTGTLGALGKAGTVAGLATLPGDIKSKLTGSGQDFAGGVHKLVGGLTLQSLIDAKARGATFGALSEGELNILANSASAINDWELKDDKGKGLGVWNIDEKSFKKELDTIQNLTRRALLLSQGNQFTPDEQTVLDEMYGQSTQVDASAYFK